MNAGMASVIAAHSWFAVDDDGMMVCWFNDCGWRHERGGESFALRAAHVAEELAKAGYGNVQEALLAAADEMPIETLQGADKASAWLRRRAHGQDPEGIALVKAIHDRKATIPAEQDWNF